MNSSHRNMGLPALTRMGQQGAPLHATADNARVMRHVIEDIWNGGDLDLADHLFAPDYVNHGGIIPDLVRGPEAIKVSVVLYRTAFPNFRIAVVDLLGEGTMMALHWIAYQIPRSDRGSDRQPEERLSDPLRGMTFARMNEGRIHESWTCWESRQRKDLFSGRDVLVSSMPVGTNA